MSEDSPHLSLKDILETIMQAIEVNKQLSRRDGHIDYFNV
jgi:hypothetical protein